MDPPCDGRQDASIPHRSQKNLQRNRFCFPPVTCPCRRFFMRFGIRLVDPSGSCWIELPRSPPPPEKQERSPRLSNNNETTACETKRQSCHTCTVACGGKTSVLFGFSLFYFPNVGFNRRFVVPSQSPQGTHRSKVQPGIVPRAFVPNALLSNCFKSVWSRNHESRQRRRKDYRLFLDKGWVLLIVEYKHESEGRPALALPPEASFRLYTDARQCNREGLIDNEAVSAIAVDCHLLVKRIGFLTSHDIQVQRLGACCLSRQSVEPILH